MRSLSFAILAFLMASSSFAFSYGKFKLSTGTGLYEPEEVIFLLNSSGNIKMLENDDYYTIDGSLFFSEVTLSIQSGGDEDFIVGTVTLKDNVIVDQCASFVDAKNQYVERMGPKFFKLERWNKYKKAYLPVKAKGEQFSDACFQNLLEPYPYSED